MAKVGDQYIVTITRKISDDKDGNLYTINGMNTCVFDDYGLERLVPYRESMDYKQGMLDAFNAFEILLKILLNRQKHIDEMAIEEMIQQVGDPEILIKKIKNLNRQK